ncbi:9024_t:CDS:1, partial [Ambispora gerdemannii]
VARQPATAEFAVVVVVKFVVIGGRPTASWLLKPYTLNAL